MNTQKLCELHNARGSRWSIGGTVHRGEHVHSYAICGDRAEAVRAEYEKCGYRMVQVYPPDGSVDLATLRLDREAAKAAYDDATQRLAAACCTAVASGRSEVEVARAAGVDRANTLRPWLGKRRAAGK